MARDRMRSHVHCIQAAKVVTGTTAPGCSPGPSGQVMAVPWQWPEILQVQPKEWLTKDGNLRTPLMGGSSLIFCNHGRVMGRFALHDWEPMVLVEEIFFSFSDFTPSIWVALMALWCSVFSSAVVGCLVVLWRWQHARCLWMKEIYRWTQVKLTRFSYLFGLWNEVVHYHLTL
jgi:hypothetical protein